MTDTDDTAERNTGQELPDPETLLPGNPFPAMHAAFATPENEIAPQGHTPGPWEKCHDHPDPETARSLAHIRGPMGKWGDRVEVATVYGCNGVYDGDMTREANARLIAAAPDMLEALRAFVDGPDYISADDCVKRDQAARAVIAKATGGAA